MTDPATTNGAGEIEEDAQQHPPSAYASFVMFFEGLTVSMMQFANDVAGMFGFTRGTADPGAQLDGSGIVQPEPEDVLPRFGTYPRAEKKSDHSCARVDTYFMVRTKNYLTTRVKARSAPRLFEFIGAEVLRSTESSTNFCMHPEGILNSEAYKQLLAPQSGGRQVRTPVEGSGRRRPGTPGEGGLRAPGVSPQPSDGGSGKRQNEPPFIFCVNFALPKAPSLAPNEYVNFICYFGRTGRSNNATWEALWDRFLEMTPQQRNARLKLIPVIVDSPSEAFQKTVANKPAIIGNKLKAHWYESPNHMEVIIDVGTSVIATQVWKMMLPQSKLLAMDIAWVIEGQSEEELPEVVLGCAHLSRPDMWKATVVEPAPASLAPAAAR